MPKHTEPTYVTGLGAVYGVQLSGAYDECSRFAIQRCNKYDGMQRKMQDVEILKRKICGDRMVNNGVYSAKTYYPDLSTHVDIASVLHD